MSRLFIIFGGGVVIAEIQGAGIPEPIEVLGGALLGGALVFKLFKSIQRKGETE